MTKDLILLVNFEFIFRLLANMAEEKTESRADLGLLEEDDEFEEFPADETNKDGEGLKESTNVWEDNWDDDKVEDDFANQLR